MLLDLDFLIRGTGDPVVTLAQKALDFLRAESIVARTRFCAGIARLVPYMDRHPRVGGHRLDLRLQAEQLLASLAQFDHFVIHQRLRERLCLEFLQYDV